MKLDLGTWKCGEIRVVRQGVMSSQADLAPFSWHTASSGAYVLSQPDPRK